MSCDASAGGLRTPNRSPAIAALAYGSLRAGSVPP
jgi:hypothetical protein